MRERLERDKQLPVDEAVRLTTDMAEALDYAHRHGVVHRDIKPGNVLLGSSARIRWAQLLARLYQVLPLLCPSCGGDMRILAFLTDPPAFRVSQGLP